MIETTGLKLGATTGPGGALVLEGARPRLEALPASARAATDAVLRSTGPLVAAAGAAGAAIVVAAEATSHALNAVAMTFAVFLLVGLTLSRRSRWDAMLPFARMMLALGQQALAGAMAWVAIDAAQLASVSPASLALATLAACAGRSLAERAQAPPARIAVLGDPRAAEQLRAELLIAGAGTHEVVGVIACGPADLARSASVPLLGEITTLDELLSAHAVDLLLIEGQASREDVFDRLAETCLDLPVRVCELTQFYEDVLGRVPVSEIGSAWFRYIMHPRFRSPDTAAKRTLDITVALLAGVVFLPPIALCALLVKLHDGGPVLFRQARIGSGGREFTLLKLRTMRSEPASARWSSADDDRVTPIGRLLRRTHLDEVPQLVNVLRGEMSVVGPRPEQPAFVEHLERTLPHYNRRHLIRPGLTGWAQVHCGYAGSDAGSATKLCHDLFYLKHQSLSLDLAILVETARTLVADRQFPGPVVAPLVLAANGGVSVLGCSPLPAQARERSVGGRQQQVTRPSVAARADGDGDVCEAGAALQWRPREGVLL
jgi:exopolysaccharide biosynthesis polyprenyl glycosylphosphotransferase